MNGVATTVRRGQGGFTLIEVMAAIVIFLVGVVGVLGLLSAGTRLHQESQNLVVTNDVAEEVLLLAQREVAERAPASGDALPEAPPPQAVPSRPELHYQWKVVPAPDQSLFLLRVEVTWMEHGKTQSRTFERVLTRLASAANEARSLLIGRPK
jgi:prepilin-type N-terminal cleavage/methylation domain-containing protein